MFAVLLFAYLLSQFYRAFLAVVAADLARDLGLDAAGLSNLASAWFLAFALAQCPIGLALDRFGPRRTLACGMSCAIVGALWLAVSMGLRDATAAMALIGLGCAPVLMSGFYLIGRSYPAGHFATVSSLLLGLGSLGDPLSGAPLALAAGMFGWRGAMLGMAAITAASVLCIAVFLRDPPPAPAAKAGSIGSGIREIVGTRALWPLLPLAFVSYAGVIATRGLWITPYLESVQGLGAAARSIAATGMGLAIACGALLYGGLATLLRSAKWAVVGGCAVAVCAWIVLGLAGEGSATLALCMLGLAGCLGSPFAIVMAHARSFMPAHLVGLGVTLMNLVFMGGASIGQWLSGRYVHAAEQAGLSPPGVYGGLFVGFGSVLAIACGIYIASRPERRPVA